MRAMAASTSSIGCAAPWRDELGQPGGVVVAEDVVHVISAARGRR